MNDELGLLVGLIFVKNVWKILNIVDNKTPRTLFYTQIKKEEHIFEIKFFNENQKIRLSDQSSKFEMR